MVGPATYRLAAGSFQVSTSFKGEMSAASYAAKETAGLWTNSRMPAPDTFLTVDDVQQAILHRQGRSMMGGSGGMRTSVMPQWNKISIDDIFSGSASGERYFTVHCIVGDLIVVQPSAYEQLAYKTA